MIQKKHRRCQEGTAIYRAGLTKDQILSTHDILVTSLHYDLILNLSALLVRDSSYTIYCRIQHGNHQHNSREGLEAFIACASAKPKAGLNR